MTRGDFREILPDVVDPIETLRALASCEAVLDELRRERDALPRRIESVDAKLEQARQTVSDARRGLEDAEQRRRSLERELQEAETARGKFQLQSSMVKTNEEYTALLREIDQATARISKLEDQILESMEGAEQANEMLSEVERTQEQVESELSGQADELRKRLSEADAESECREAERSELVGTLEPKLRAQYVRIHRGRGDGTSTLVGRGCARCHRDVPFEVINRLRKGEIHTCGNCGRLLIVDDATGERSE